MWSSIVTSLGLICDLGGAALLAYGIISWRSSYRDTILEGGLKTFEDAKKEAETTGNSYMAEVWEKLAKQRRQELEHFEHETLSLNTSLALRGIVLLTGGFVLQLVGVWIGN